MFSIRRRVCASSDALDVPFPPKPPKMRWATYEHLRAVDAALQEQWLLGAAGGLGPRNATLAMRRSAGASEHRDTIFRSWVRLQTDTLSRVNSALPLPCATRSTGGDSFVTHVSGASVS